MTAGVDPAYVADADSHYGMGATHMFVGDGADWSYARYIKAPNAGSDDWDYFGDDIAISGDAGTLVVGARWEASASTGINSDGQDDDSLEGSGAAYVY